MNKIKFLILIVLYIITFLSFAQKNNVIEPAILECEYDHQKIKDTLNRSNFTKDIMILRIGKNISQFYSYYTLYGQTMTRQELVTVLEDAMMKNDFKNLPTARTTEDYIYKNYPGKGKIAVYTKLIIDFFTFEEKYAPQEWLISDSTKQILGYFCQKAQCGFRGRIWTAWFTPDIPISDGPWKLNGLPGLILEAYDENRDYAYTIRSIKQSDLTPVTFYNPKNRRFEKTDRFSFLKAKSRAYFKSDAMEEIEAVTGIKLDKDTSSSKRPKVNYDFEERDYQ